MNRNNAVKVVLAILIPIHVIVLGSRPSTVVIGCLRNSAVSGKRNNSERRLSRESTISDYVRFSQ
jgi:hypothetical protein